MALGALDPARVFQVSDPSPALRDPCALFLAFEQQLVLARGPFGGRPVYFALLDEGKALVACSDLLPVVEQLEGRTEIDVEGLAAVVSTREGPDPTRTPYARVRRLAACQVVRFTAGTKCVSIEPPPQPARTSGKAEDLAAEFREILVEIVARDARGLSRASVMTGGGMDSSGVLAVAKLGYRQGRHRCLFDAVAMDFGGPGDDRPHLRALCSSLEIEPLRVQPEEAVRLVPSVLTADAAPLYWPTYPLEMAAVRRAARAGAEAIFTGSGGDVVTGGDFSFYSERTLGRRLLPAMWGAAKLETLWPSSPSSRVMDLVLKPAARRLVPRSWLELRRVDQLTRTHRWAWAGRRLRAFLLEDAERAAGEEQLQEKSWYSWMALSHDLVRVADLRGQCEHESRLAEHCPYLDAKLVEFVAGIPPEMRFHGHRDRGLFREAMRGLLPESLRTRPDKADFEPMLNEVGTAAHSKGALGRLVKMEALGDLGLVDPAAFECAVRRAVAKGDGRVWADVWPALAAEAFMGQYTGSLAPAGDEAS